MADKKVKSQSEKTKKSVKKATVEVKTSARSRSAQPKAEQKSTISAPVLGKDGAKTGTVSLPSEIFGAKINPVLMAQAVRVYLANQRQGTSSTKTRSEVAGTTKKVWRQKGTGRARHGSAKAPLFVGGGITFGPKPRDYRLTMPQKMRKAALASALTAQLNGDAIKFVDVLGEIDGKTRDMAKMLSSIGVSDKKKTQKVLVVFGDGAESVRRAAKNIHGVVLRAANTLNTYEVLNSNHIVFMKNALETLESSVFKVSK